MFVFELGSTIFTVVVSVLCTFWLNYLFGLAKQLHIQYNALTLAKSVA